MQHQLDCCPAQLVNNLHLWRKLKLIDNHLLPGCGVMAITKEYLDRAQLKKYQGIMLAAK